MLLEELCQRYREGERDFRGINLRESDLTNIALPGVNFCRADLRQARLVGLKQISSPNKA